MKADELKDIWKEQDNRDDMDYSNAELLELMKGKLQTFENDIQRRDRLEWAACLLIVVVFGIIFFVTPSFWQKAGAAIIVFSGCLIGFILSSVRKRKGGDGPSANHSVQQHLMLELQWIRKQKRLLEHVIWWYILPLLTGLIVFTIGLPNGLTFKTIYIAIVIALGGAIWKLNKNAIEERFDPMIGEMVEALNFLEDSDD